MNNYIYNQMVYFTIMFDFTWSVSDCEELVGGYSLGVVGLVEISQ